ncbi:MAG: hypothetical protein ABIA78_01655 [archaeon]
MKKQVDYAVLDQLLKSLEEAVAELESSYKNKNYENFNKSKKLLLNVQVKISEVIE